MLDISIVLYRPGPLERRLVSELPGLTPTPHTLRVFDNSSNQKNLSTAWNELAAYGRAPFVAFLHSDLVLSKGWEQPLIQCLSERDDVGVALPNPARFDQIGRSFPLSDPPTATQMEAWASYSRQQMAGAILPFAVDAGDCAVFFCVIMRRADFERLRGFDERLRFVGNNHEFQWRMSALGRMTAMVHASSVWHKDALSFYKAIQNNDFTEGKEGEHWRKWSTMLRDGKTKKWHELSDAERAAVRSDRSFRINA